jgi:hypothetical protein
VSKWRTEEFGHQRQSVLISADWDTEVDAFRSFTQLLRAHEVTPQQMVAHVRKARADFEAGANVCEVHIESGYTVSLFKLSNLGHNEEGK